MGGKRIIQFSQRNGKLPLQQWKQGNYPVINIYAQEPDLVTLNINTSEHLNIYNNAIIELPESGRYELTISKWTEFYQDLEDAVSTFGFKSEVMIVKKREKAHESTELKNVI